MKIERIIKIPKGYRRLRKGERVRRSDLYTYPDLKDPSWLSTNLVGRVVGIPTSTGIYIRKKAT